MLLHGHSFANRRHHVEINVASYNGGSGLAFLIDTACIRNNDTPWIDDETVSVGFSFFVVPAVLRSGNHVALVFNGACCATSDTEV